MNPQASASSSTRLSLELPEVTPSTVVEPSSPNSPVEPPSPSASNGFQKRSPHGAAPPSPSGAKIHRGISDVVGMASGNSPQILNAASTSERSGLFGRTLSASAAFITRSRSAVQTFNHWRPFSNFLFTGLNFVEQ
nr:Cytospin-B like [Ipomoea batatas]